MLSPGPRTDLAPGGDLARDAVDPDPQRRVREASLGSRAVEFEREAPAAAHDDILGLGPMEMQGRLLALVHDHDLLGIALARSFPRADPGFAVAQGEQEQSPLCEVAGTEIGQVPAEAIVHDLGVGLA